MNLTQAPNTMNHAITPRIPCAPRQVGAALVIALVLLLILTILAFTGLNTSITESTMANNEQFRHGASQAAEGGIEAAIANLANVPTVRGAPPLNSGWRNLSQSSAEQYSSTTRFLGVETNLPQSSTDKFIGLHYSIDTDGRGPRNARDQQTQGVLVVASTGGANGDFGQIGTGLGP